MTLHVARYCGASSEEVQAPEITDLFLKQDNKGT
jgi:hypothetical protein